MKIKIDTDKAGFIIRLVRFGEWMGSTYAVIGVTETRDDIEFIYHVDRELFAGDTLNLRPTEEGTLSQA